MSKLTTTDLTKIDSTAIEPINSNFAAVETALENTLSRDGTAPNTMGADIDMDGHTILNLGVPSADTHAVRLRDLHNLVAGETPDYLVTTSKIADDAVTDDKLADMEANTIKGAIDAGSPVNLTAAQVLAIVLSAIAGASINGLAMAGVNGDADATNKFLVQSSSVLFNNIGNNIRVKINKNAAANTASVLFQTNWGGRAEIGTLGNDNFAFKVSSDGSNWYTGLELVPGASGVPKVPSFTVAGLPSAVTAGAGAICYVSNASGGAVLAFSDGTVWRKVTDRVTVS